MKDKYRKEVDGEWYLQELQKDGGMKWIHIQSTFGKKENTDNFLIEHTSIADYIKKTKRNPIKQQ